MVIYITILIDIDVFFFKLSHASSTLEESTGLTNRSSSIVHVEDPLISRDTQEAYPHATPQLVQKALDQDFVAGPSQVQSELTMSKYFYDSNGSSNLNVGDGGTGDTSQIWQDGTCSGILLFCTISLPPIN